MSDSLTTRLAGRERMEAKDRLDAIAKALSECFRAERTLSDRIQRLRDEQADLNAKVYRS